MYNEIKHLLNTDTQRFICMGGIMASGKSTIVSEFEKVGYIVICPDRLRVEFAKQVPGNENKLEGELQDILMNFEAKTWAVAQRMVIDNLKKGKSVIFDATMLTAKARKQPLEWARQAGVQATALFLECPVEIALERNLKRSRTTTGKDAEGNYIYGRYVPSYIIELKAKSQVLPTHKEGFQEIYILHVELEKNNKVDEIKKIYESSNLEEYLSQLQNSKELEKLLPSLVRSWGIDQENKNHNLPLHIHMINAGKHLQNDKLELFLAGLLHDVGKVDTKRKYGKLLENTEAFKQGEKVEWREVAEDTKHYIISKLDYTGYRTELIKREKIQIDENAHFYDHNINGAILARRDIISAGFDEVFANTIYELILYHMDLPFQAITGKSPIVKLLDKINIDIMDLVVLREADKFSSNGDTYFKKIHSNNVKLINEVIEERAINYCIKATIKELVSYFGKTEQEAKEMIKNAKMYESLVNNPIGTHESTHNWVLKILLKNDGFNVSD